MRIEDRGARNEQNGEGGKLDLQSPILDPAMLQRIRWRCRRGLLELDIVLGRFIEAHYAQLDDAGRQAFEVLLDMPDNPLWDMISGRLEAAPRAQQALLEKLKTV